MKIGSCKKDLFIYYMNQNAGYFPDHETYVDCPPQVRKLAK